MQGIFEFLIKSSSVVCLEKTIVFIEYFYILESVHESFKD